MKHNILLAFALLPTRFPCKVTLSDDTILITATNSNDELCLDMRDGHIMFSSDFEYHTKVYNELLQILFTL